MKPHIPGLPIPIPDDWWPSRTCLASGPIATMSADELAGRVAAFIVFAKKRKLVRVTFGHTFKQWLEKGDDWSPSGSNNE